MGWKRLVPFLLAGAGNAVVRFHCSQLVVQRIDPLVNSGSIPSSHVHQIVGGVRASSPLDLVSTSISDRHKCRTPSMRPWIR